MPNIKQNNTKIDEQELWLNTPCFVIDKDDLDQNIEALRSSLDNNWINYDIGYSYKTCAIPWVLRYLKQRGLKAEVVSPTEFELAKQIGYEIKDIIYNGPIKTKETLEQAINAGSIVNLDSKREVFWVSEIAKANPEKFYKIGLRVNFDINSECPGETVAGERGNRFGFSYETGDLTNVITYLNDFVNLKIVGLHMHVSTKSRSENIYEVLATKALEITRKYQLELENIDIGGGFFAGGSFNHKFADYIKTIAEVLKQEYTPETLKLIVEPGASLIASPLSLYSKVIDVKDSYCERLVVTDASRCLIDPFMHKEKYSYKHVIPGQHQLLRSDIESVLPKQLISPVNATEQRLNLKSQTICGYTCMENDRLMQLKDHDEIRFGDGIIYETVGSYTVCFNPLFIEYLPKIYLFESGSYRLIREAWTVDEFLAGDLSKETFEVE